MKDFRRLYWVMSRTVHRTFLAVLEHDCLNIAQSSAYSAIVALFPALIVAAAIVGLLPHTASLRLQLAIFFDRILPPDVTPLLDVYFQRSPKNTHSARALVVAAVVSAAGASNVLITLMEGLRRAKGLPTGCWRFWQRRRRALVLVPQSLIPLAIASLLVVFGNTFNAWLAPNLAPVLRETLTLIALLIRWAVALSASVGLIAVIYHRGTPAGEPWKRAIPGAVVATAMWFLTTLVFGWYVTRFANYSEVYGSLGAGIALLFWLYIISLSVLCGAEFNAQFYAHVRGTVPAE